MQHVRRAGVRLGETRMQPRQTSAPQHRGDSIGDLFCVEAVRHLCGGATDDIRAKPMPVLNDLAGRALQLPPRPNQEKSFNK